MSSKDTTMALDKSNFLRQHLFYPFVFLTLTSTIILAFNIDVRLEDYFYALQGHSWSWKNAWLTERVIHEGGRAISIFLAASVLILLSLSSIIQPLKNARKPLLYLFLGVAGASISVALLKMSLAISCPWEFDRYGGTLSYSNVMQQLDLHNGQGCFPAGHASAGYSWVALYFFGLFFKSRLRWLGLIGALTGGIIFGFAQQLRGAHFISHDLWSLAVCWFYCLGLYLIFSHNLSTSYFDSNAAVPANSLS